MRSSKRSVQVLWAVLVAGCGALDASPEPVVDVPVDDGSLTTLGWQGGTGLDDQVTGLVVGADGVVYVGGFEGALWNVDRYLVGGSARGVVKKVLEDGTVAWSRTIAVPTGAVDLTSLAPDPVEGGVWVAGRTTGALPGFVNAGQMDAFATRFADDGTPAFTTQWGDARPENPRHLERIGDRLFVAGYHDTFVPTNYVERWEDPFVEGWTLGAAGPVRDWQQRFDSPGSDLIQGAAVAADGTTYVVGSRASGSLRGPFLIAYSASGQVDWQLRFTSIASDHAAAVRIAPDGNVVVAGSTFANFLGHRNAGQQDAFVVKVDVATGQPLWSALVGGKESDWVTTMDLDAKGNVWLGGETLGEFEPGFPADGSIDGFVAFVTNTGRVVKRVQLATPAEESVTVVRAQGLSAVVGGWTLGDLFAPNAGGMDGFVTTVRFEGP